MGMSSRAKDLVQAHILLKVKGQGHRVTKCNNLLKVIVYLSVCPHDKTKKAEIKIAELGTNTEILRSPINITVGQKVKSQGHMGIKYKKAIVWLV